MIEFTGHLEVEAPPGEVFELLADMAEVDRWNPNVRNSKRTVGERLEPGSRYESVIARGPLRMTALPVLVSAEAGRAVRYEGPIGGFWSVDSLTFQPSEKGTHIVFHNQTRTPTWLRPLTPLLKAVFRRQAGRAVEGAGRYLADPAGTW